MEQEIKINSHVLIIFSKGIGILLVSNFVIFNLFRINIYIKTLILSK